MILILSGYDAGSHKRWHTGLRNHLVSLGYDVAVETMPPRHFRWRVRGNPLYFAYGRTDLWTHPWKLVIATSAVDVATLRSLTKTRCPWIVYVHENQFAYPLRPGQKRRDGALLIRDLYTVLAADHAVFNSEYNRTTLIDGTVQFLDGMPDFNTPPIEALKSSTSVIPVPLDDELFAPKSTRDTPPPLRLLWNHRWEWDKAPQTFFNALRLARNEGLEFRLNIVGQQFRNTPAAFDEGRADFDAQIDRWGFQDRRADYLDAIDESHVVVSTSHHEFQGLAVLEAAARGCVPALPDRLAYPEHFDSTFLYESTPEDPEREAASLAEWLLRRSPDLPNAPDLQHLAWSNLGPQWTTLVEHWYNP